MWMMQQSKVLPSTFTSDYSASERRGSYSGESLQKMMGLLQENFPGIEDKSTTDVEDGESSNADDTA